MQSKAMHGAMFYKKNNSYFTSKWMMCQSRLSQTCRCNKAEGHYGSKVCLHSFSVLSLASHGCNLCHFLSRPRTTVWWSVCCQVMWPCLISTGWRNITPSGKGVLIMVTDHASINSSGMIMSFEMSFAEIPLPTWMLTRSLCSMKQTAASHCNSLLISISPSDQIFLTHYFLHL